jgi:hypothetical protein
MVTWSVALVTLISTKPYYTCGRPLNYCSGIGRWSGKTRENGQYLTTEEDRRCLQASLQTALDSWRQE